jgi:CubicO group peptidase (beta-lactamase class C family)
MSRFLEDFERFIKENDGRVFSVTEIVGNNEPEKIELVENNASQNIYSVSKMYSVTAIGILWDRGSISVDDTVTDILGEQCPEGYEPYWKETTVDMLMRHRVGFPGGFDTDVTDASKYDPDYLKEIMLKKWVCPPDTERHYEDASYYILSRIVNKVSGKPLFNFCWENIFLPLSFKEAAWSCCPKGHAIGATGLYIRCEDMIKLGAVYLNGGEYRGNKIISENWINKVLEREYEFKPNGIKDSYNKGGLYGQELLVIPCENKVVGWQANDRRPETPDFTKYAAEYDF